MIALAVLVCTRLPSAGRMRFTNSGSEDALALVATLTDRFGDAESQ